MKLRAVIVVLLFFPALGLGQLQISLFTGAYVPLSGRLANFWTPGVDLGLSVDVPLSHSLFLKSTARFSRHSFTGDSASFHPLINDKDFRWEIVRFSSDTHSDFSTTYDLSAEIQYQASLGADWLWWASTGVCYSKENFGIGRFWDIVTNFPFGVVPRPFVVALSFDDRSSWSQSFGTGVRYNFTKEFGAGLQARLYTTYGNTSNLALNAVLTYTIPE
jgi:hypothetical protein